MSISISVLPLHWVGTKSADRFHMCHTPKSDKTKQVSGVGCLGVGLDKIVVGPWERLGFQPGFSAYESYDLNWISVAFWIEL